MEKLVSIIVPVYNVENYLTECIESTLNQTYHNVEIILIDDGSTDRSGKICDTYANKDNRIKVFHKKNGNLLSTNFSDPAIAISASSLTQAFSIFSIAPVGSISSLSKK